MSNKENVLFALLKLGIRSVNPNDRLCEVFQNLTLCEWREVLEIASQQGVAAVAIDGLQTVFSSNQIKIKAAQKDVVEWKQFILECAGLLTQYEQRSILQKKVISHISGSLNQEGIQMMVFKGQANASIYPIPSHRATGDIDCYLFGNKEKGDEFLRTQGALIDDNWYRHSKISYEGEIIENHRVLSHTRGNKIRREMEKEFKEMLQPMNLRNIPDCGKALMPSPFFNACFLTYHGLHHFLTEGLRLKQILDWVVFVKKEQQYVDWSKFISFCKRYKMDRFAAAMNYIAAEYFGVKLLWGIYTDERYGERIIEDVFTNDNYLFNSGKSDWVVRWLLVKNMFSRDRWKYSDIAQENVLKYLWGNAKGFLLGGNE